MTASLRSLKICLAASGGGHVRQLLDLSPAWESHDHFFITEDTALGRSIAAGHRTHLVAHVALGQAKLGAPFRMAAAAVRNFFQSCAIILRERPDVMISTGAGSVFFSVLWARLLGARVVVVESFARFDRLSAFAKIAGPLAHHKVVQSRALKAFWPDAEVFDPLKVLDTPRPPKRALLFATVGATLSFDRLVRSVAELKERGEIPEDVIVQTGTGGIAPEGVTVVETLAFEEVLEILREADIVVCHGGTGSLITALREGCRLVAMPRLFELGEHYDNHQAEITAAFRDRGLLEIATTSDDLSRALAAVRARAAAVATSDPVALTQYLQNILTNLATRSPSKAAQRLPAGET